MSERYTVQRKQKLPFKPWPWSGLSSHPLNPHEGPASCGVTPVMIPTATVLPPSLSATRPSALHTPYSSTHSGRVGVTCSTAACPLSTQRGLRRTSSPLLASRSETRPLMWPLSRTACAWMVTCLQGRVEAARVEGRVRPGLPCMGWDQSQGLAGHTGQAHPNPPYPSPTPKPDPHTCCPLSTGSGTSSTTTRASKRAAIATPNSG